MMLVSIIVITLLVLILIKEIGYLRSLCVTTKKTTLEILIQVVGIGILILLTYFYAKTALHYIVAFLGISTFIVLFLKNGLSKDGPIVNATSKEKYLWSELSYVELIKADSIIVKYYSQNGRFIGKHIYSRKDEDQVLQLLKYNVPIK